MSLNVSQHALMRFRQRANRTGSNRHLRQELISACGPGVGDREIVHDGVRLVITGNVVVTVLTLEMQVKRPVPETTE